MRVQKFSWNASDGWQNTARNSAGLVLYFGSREILADGARYDEIRAMFPGAHVIGCTTGGQIQDDDVGDDQIAAVALEFDATRLRIASETVTELKTSRACGEAIGRQLAADDLAGVFVLSDGLHVNGSELVAGITAFIGTQTPLTGGLAGDGPDFVETLVGADSAPRTRTVVGVGFYGSAVRFGHGSAGGWDVFGPRRRVTRSNGNVLYDLDGQPALELYERYLGEEAKDLPGSALLFPLQVSDPLRPDDEIVRTVLSIDRAAKSMTFAGDIPEGWVAQLMRGNFDRLSAGAADAAAQAQLGAAENGEGVAVLVSCIGRRLLMGQRTIEEVDAARAQLAPEMPSIGFYSYGEISPHAKSGICNLHNQTMTVTTITEAVD